MAKNKGKVQKAQSSGKVIPQQTKKNLKIKTAHKKQVTGKKTAAVKKPVIDSDSDSSSSSEVQQNLKVSKLQKVEIESESSTSSEEEQSVQKMNPEQDSSDEVSVNQGKQVEVSGDEDSDDQDQEESDDEESDEESECQEDEEEQALDGQEEADEDEDEEDSDESIDVPPKKMPNTKKKPLPEIEMSKKPSFQEDDSFPPSTRIFIKNLPHNADSNSIQSFFASKGLKTIDVYHPGAENSKKDFAFAEFEDIGTATKATKMSGQAICGSEVEITFAKPRKGAQSSFQKGQSRESFGGNNVGTNIVFVKNLGPSVNQEILRNHFEDAQDIRVMTNDDGSCRGHAFVEFDSNESAKSAYDQMKGKKINGSEVILDFAQPRNQNRGGFRGNRGFGGYRGDSGGNRQSFGSQRGGHGFRGRGGFGGRGNDRRGFGGRIVGKASRGAHQQGYGKKIQFNEDDD